MSKTKEQIHTDMMDNVSNDFEKIEGSFIYAATKPAAIEIEKAYLEISKVEKSITLAEATDDALTELCYQNGTFRREGETDEELLARHIRNLTEPAQDGNASQYLEWATNFPGVGTAKVIPLWNGGNTVKIAITNSNYLVADQTLVNDFQNFIDPGAEGLGNGAAPIGAKVTVSGGIRKDINITANVVLAEGYTQPEGVAESINQYFASIVYKKGNTNANNNKSVSYMRTAVAIIDTPSIVDMSNFTINGGTVDIPIVGEENPTLNSINLTVVAG